jgi:hypothetical protein
MTSLVGSASSIPHPLHGEAADPRGGEVEPTRPMSPELTAAIARAQVAWARRWAPWLLEEWLA